MNDQTKVHLTWNQVYIRADELELPPSARMYPIPNGGVAAALCIKAVRPEAEIVDHPGVANVFVDDIIDSGRTRIHWKHRGKDTPFLALVDKQGRDREWMHRWVTFPWERLKKNEGPEENIVRLLQYIGEDPEREGLQETPKRVVKSYCQIFGGYEQDASTVLKTFSEGSYDEMVLLKDIEFYSTCEHHMQPFFGKAHIAYIPNGRVIGVSKLARILEVYSRRLQIQERLTTQIADALMQHLKPLGAAVVLEARHFCMVCRGVQKQGSIMVTSSLQGAFRDNPETRAEFMGLIK